MAKEKKRLTVLFSLRFLIAWLIYGYLILLLNKNFKYWFSGFINIEIDGCYCVGVRICIQKIGKQYLKHLDSKSMHMTSLLYHFFMLFFFSSDFFFLTTLSRCFKFWSQSFSRTLLLLSSSLLLLSSRK